MTDNEYRRLPRLANSDLSELLNLKVKGINGKTIDPQAALFGTIFHQITLEPQKPVIWTGIGVKDQYKMMQMAESFEKHVAKFYPSGLPDIFQQAELVRMWIDPATGLPCKAKMDIAPNECIAFPGREPETIYDLKTTSAKTSQEFMDCFVKYGYDRQAAFYLDGWQGGYNFTFIAVQKIKPYAVFEIQMHRSDMRRAMIDGGRRKNAGLLRQAKRELADPTGWRPSSWQYPVKEVVV